MKIQNHLPGSIRPEPIQTAKKNRKASDTGAAAASRGAGRDEYIKQNRGIMPKLHTSVSGGRGAEDAQDVEADGLGARMNKPLAQTGGAGEPAAIANACRPDSRGPDLVGFSGTAALLTIDIHRQGFQCSYTAEDAAISLWRQKYTLIGSNDPDSLARLQERVRCGNLSLNPTAEELAAFTDGLRQNGLTGEVDWAALTREFASFESVRSDELVDGLDYLASRYAAVLDKLIRNFSGDALTDNCKTLESVWNKGIERMIGHYAAGLQNALSLSDADAGAMKDSLSLILGERAAVYTARAAQVSASVIGGYPEDHWLQNHDAFLAARLREAVGADSGTRALYSAQDLAFAGEIAQAYSREMVSAASGGRHEASLALNVSMVDIKVETLIRRGSIGENMAVLLRSTRIQIQAVALSVSDQHLSQREHARLPNGSARPFPAMDRKLFGGIYRAVMDAFYETGDVPGAIRAGAAYGQAAAEKAAGAYPEATHRRDASLEDYWNSFFITPQPSGLSALEQEVDVLLSRIGRSRGSANSTYQNYVNGWQDFLASLDRGVDSFLFE